MQDIHIHLGGEVLGIKAINQVHAGSGVSGKGQQIHRFALEQSEHDGRVTKAVQRPRLPGSRMF